MELFWISRDAGESFAVVTRPRGGDWLEDDLQRLHRSGVAVLVSMLTAPEEAELALGEEGAIARAKGLTFVSIPVPDRGLPPSVVAFAAQIRALKEAIAARGPAAIHCRQGIGRSCLCAASLLVAGGVEPDEAWRRVAAARGRSVPDTLEQQAWLDQVAAQL